MSEHGSGTVPRPGSRLVELLGVAGAVGGFLWAAIPLVAALAFYGVETGRAGLGDLVLLGSFLQVAPLAVVGLLAGAVGVHRRFRGSVADLGRAGTVVTVIGVVLLLPGSVVPSGWLPPSLSSAVPLVFFAGLCLVALGSLGFGLAARRAALLPSALAVGYAVAMPVGFVLGAAAALAGAGNIALVIGLLVPYGLAWVALGSYLAWADR